MLPFPTAVVASAFQDEDLSDERIAIVFYALVAAAAAAWLVLFHFLSRAPYRLEDQAHAVFFAAERRRAGPHGSAGPTVLRWSGAPPGEWSAC